MIARASSQGVEHVGDSDLQRLQETRHAGLFQMRGEAGQLVA